MNAFAQFILFVSSYAPLFAVLALLNSFGAGWPNAVCWAAFAFGICALPATFIATLKLSEQPLEVTSAQVRDGDALAYIATYIVPFAASNLSTTREQLALGFFVLLLAVIYVRSELLYVNPLLAIAGFRVFQVVSPQGAVVIVITHRRFLASGKPISVRRLGDYVYWEAKA